jgi:peptidoglycan/xylan/chitin deacetylase (PgdA/CDA1 family)
VDLRLKKQTVIRAGLETLYFTQAHNALRGFVGGIGAILTLHHVRLPRPEAFQPNRLLEVCPTFLESTIDRLLHSGVDFVDLDEMHRRLTERDFSRRFVCITLDDGYRDNRRWAYPIFKQFGVPFAIYLPTSFAEGRGELWWIVLERVVAANKRLHVKIDGEERIFSCATLPEKQETYDTLYWSLRGLPHEDDLRASIREIAQRYAIDIPALCAELCMGWPELTKLVADPLVTIGAHTVTHPMLAKVSEQQVRQEMLDSATAIERAVGVRPAHFSYPVGDASSAGPREFAIAAELGFKTGVTTRPGMLFAEHREHLAALPRISLNGEFQRMRYVDVLLSGAATALWNGFRRVNAA